jgi:hypothetical protein
VKPRLLGLTSCEGKKREVNKEEELELQRELGLAGAWPVYVGERDESCLVISAAVAGFTERPAEVGRSQLEGGRGT